MKHLSYFLALLAVGTFGAIMVLQPVLTPIAMLLASAVGISTSSEGLKVLEYGVPAVLWIVVLVVIWKRNGGLSPSVVKKGAQWRLSLGHVCLVLAHVLLVCIFTVPALGYLMILPVVGVLLGYAVGVILIESARERRQFMVRQ